MSEVFLYHIHDGNIDGVGYKLSVNPNEATDHEAREDGYGETCIWSYGYWFTQHQHNSNNHVANIEGRDPHIASCSGRVKAGEEVKIKLGNKEFQIVHLSESQTG